jgi:DNA-binding LytR/AlgR family response regulator
MPYQCFIIDDEPIAIDVIRAHLERLPDFEVAGAFEDPLRAFQAIRQTRVDLIFLDIQMPGLSGLDLLRTLRQPVDVILTTAHREFALEGFELNVIDYLLKPVSFDRFLQATGKFLDKRRPPGERQAEAVDHIFVRADRKSVRVDFEAVLYVEGLKDYVKIITTSGMIVTKESIGQIEEALPPGQFLRIHRSFIVARQKITAYTPTHVEIGEKVLPVGRTYRAGFLQSMN